MDARDEEEIVEHHPVRRVPMARGQSPYYSGGLSVGTKILIVAITVPAGGLAVLAWVLGPTLRPGVEALLHLLGNFTWLVVLVLVVGGISAALGLIRRLGVLAVVEDIVMLVLKIQEHRRNARLLHADKQGNYPRPFYAEQQYVVDVAPGNAPGLPAGGVGAFPQLAAASRRRGQQQVVDAVSAPSQQGAQVSGTSQQQGNGAAPRLAEIAERERWEDWALDENAGYQPQRVPGRYNFIEELEHFRPSVEGLFLGRSAEGPIILPISKLWHVVFAAPTGGGKSKIVRMLFAQLIALNMQCYVCDTHYAPMDADGLDWTPIEARLAYPPLREARDIDEFLEWLARKELKAREDRFYYKKPIGAPIFVLLEELPSVIEDYPRIAGNIGKLLREARKYRICLAMAAQGLLVKTIGLDSDMLQNLRTGYYINGNTQTMKIALALQDGQKSEIDERGLGDGLVYLRTIEHPPTKARIPWPDNPAIEALCELSTLPVREIVREEPSEGLEVESIYQPSSVGRQQEQAPANVRTFPDPAQFARGRGKQQVEMDPAHVDYARRARLSDAKLAQALDITQYQANRINGYIREHPLTDEGSQEEEKQVNE